MGELVFEVIQEADGGYTAECLGEDIFTQGDTWEELCQNAKEAVRGYFFDAAPTPSGPGSSALKRSVAANGLGEALDKGP